MPPIQDMTSAASASEKTASGLSDDARLLDALQHQVAVFARRAEQTRLGAVGKVRNSMDRAAYLLLNRLDREGPMGVKALAAGMGIDSSTVTRQVAPLVDSGLVKRASHPEDGRAVVLQLSSRGQSRLEEVRASRRELMAQVTDGWSEDERDAFTTLLTRFNSSLSARQARMQPPEGADNADASDSTGALDAPDVRDAPDTGRSPGFGGGGRVSE